MSNPKISRVVDAGGTPAYVLFILIACLIPLALIIYHILCVLKWSGLLRSGKETMGKMIDCKQVSKRNHRTKALTKYYIITLEFEDEAGNVYETKFKTQTHTKKMKRRQVVYPPGNPLSATAMDAITGEPKIDEDGYITMSTGVLSLLCIIPGIVLIMAAINLLRALGLY